MKKNDIAMIILIIAITAVASYFIGKAVIGDPDLKAIQVDTAQPISPSFPTPDKRIFNDKSINPAVHINIGGDSANTDPFSSSSSQ